jgi:hypothetical protein
MQMFAYKGKIDSNNRFYSEACRGLPPFMALRPASATVRTVLSASVNGGTSLAFGVSAANDIKIRAANVALQVAQANAQIAKAASEQVAKDLLASQGAIQVRDNGVQ